MVKSCRGFDIISGGGVKDLRYMDRSWAHKTGHQESIALVKSSHENCFMVTRKIAQDRASSKHERIWSTKLLLLKDLQILKGSAYTVVVRSDSANRTLSPSALSHLAPRILPSTQTPRQQSRHMHESRTNHPQPPRPNRCLHIFRN